MSPRPQHAQRRRRPSAWVVSLCLPAAALVMAPGAAMGADTGSSTVRAVIGGDGSVKNVKQYGTTGSASTFNGKLPVELSIQRSKDGARTTLRYHVENVQTATQDVTYTDTAGVAHTSKVELQLPLVAQLGVTIPSSMTDVAADGAAITTDADGTKHLLWQMVLFSPLGAPVQDVYLSGAGTGTPAAQVRAITVDPTTAAGLGGTAQAANQAQTQDDFWHQYASGGNDGLTKLRTGMGQIVAGLELLAPGAKKLASGLGAAGDGANKLDAGTAQAKGGAGELSTGLGKIAAGQSDLTDGLTLIHDGQSSLTDGLTQIHTGQGALTDGLTLISGGLGQLADPAKGLPAASAGLAQITAGLTALQAGVGSKDDTAAQETLVGGVTAVSAGITQLKTGIVQSSTCTAYLLTKVINGSTADGSKHPCFVSAANPQGFVLTIGAATDPVGKLVLTAIRDGNAAVAAGTDTTLTPGIAALQAGLAKIRGGLAHTPGALGATDAGGVAGGLAAVKAGVGQVADGLTKAVAGVQALDTGAAAALDGSKKLYAGSGEALAGSEKLTDGSASALDGSTQLRDGAGKAYTGSKALLDGLGQLSTGQHQVATGLPAAIDGANQIADGLAKVLPGGTQVKDGIGQVQDAAVAPLEKQLKEGAQNARQQVAVLAAAGALAKDAPGGAGTSYVLAQDGFDLAAATTSTDGTSNGEKVGLGVGGLLLLVLGTAGGFFAGRKRQTV